jgi:hypothetical protein
VVPYLSPLCTVLALATLGDATQIGLFLFFVALPKVAKASTSVLLWGVTVAGIITPTFANVNMALIGTNTDFFTLSSVITKKFYNY